MSASSTRSVFNVVAFGGLNIFLRLISLCLMSNVVYKFVEKIFEIDVVIVVLVIFIVLNVLMLKMKSGSRTTFNI